MSKTNQKAYQILIVGPAWIGDMVMAQTLFKFLQSKDERIAIDVLAPKWTFPLLERMPEVRSKIFFPLDHGQLQLKQRYLFAKQLRQKNYNQAIILPSSLKSALTPLWAKIPIRTGWLGEWRWGLLNDVRVLKKQYYPQMIQQFVALGLPKNEVLPMSLEDFYPKLIINESKRQVIVDRLQLKLTQPILGICPGAEFGPSKRWPSEYFSFLAKQMISAGWQVWIFGSHKDKDIAKTIIADCNANCVDLTGKTSLTEAIDLLSLTQAVVSNDSGLMHIAAALNRPLVMIYGSSSPDFTPPLTNRVAMLKEDLECSPCFKRSCPLGHLNCMKKISPHQVIDNLKKLT